MYSSSTFGLRYVESLLTQEIGRFTASNYEIIKIIFEINLRFFNQESTKRLLFVIRDYKDSENFEHIEKTIKGDVLKIWKEIKKPKIFEDVDPGQFFEVELFPVHNFVYEKPRFETDCAELASRFRDPKNKNFYFRGVDIQKNIPFDGMSAFTEQVWTSIKENKELNLPSQKIIVSNFRCATVRKESLDISRSDVQLLMQSVKIASKKNLKGDLENIMNKSMTFYRANTEHYEDEIVTEVEKELRKELRDGLEEISNVQKDNLESEHVRLFKEKLNYYKSMNDISVLMSNIHDLKKESLAAFDLALEESTLEQTENNEKTKNRFKLKIESMIREMLTGKINSLLKKIQNEKTKQFDVVSNRILTELSPKFWQQFLDNYNLLFESYTQEIMQLKNSIL
jgi:hypothetical protein